MSFIFLLSNINQNIATSKQQKNSPATSQKGVHDTLQALPCCGAGEGWRSRASRDWSLPLRRDKLHGKCGGLATADSSALREPSLNRGSVAPRQAPKIRANYIESLAKPRYSSS
jgi:hypothetical protein